MPRPVAIAGGPTDWNEALEIISFGSPEQVGDVACPFVTIMIILIIMCGTIVLELVIHVEN